MLFRAIRAGGEGINEFINLKLSIWIEFVVDRKAWDDLVQRMKTRVGS